MRLTITRRLEGRTDPLAERYILQATRPPNGPYVSEILHIPEGERSGCVVGWWRFEGDPRCAVFSSCGDRYAEHIERLSEFPELISKGQTLAELMGELETWTPIPAEEAKEAVVQAVVQAVRPHDYRDQLMRKMQLRLARLTGDMSPHHPEYAETCDLLAAVRDEIGRLP